MAVGLNYRTAPVEVRERFWISEMRRREALVHLSQAEGIEEVIVLATCNRTEFWLWTSDVTLAANSVMRLLGAEYGLKLGEWKHFYRLLDEAALLHIFRVASSLDSMVVGEPHVVSQVKDAWKQAQKVGASGRFLDAVLQKAVAVSERVREETTLANGALSTAYAAVKLTRKIFGTLENKNVVLLSAGKMSELAAQDLLDAGGESVSVTVINRTLGRAKEVAARLGGSAFPLQERIPVMAEADVVISSTSCPHTIFGREEAELVIRERRLHGAKEGQPLVIIDIALPRDIAAEVREVKGIFLYDLDDLENVVDLRAHEREAAAEEAQKILQAEAHGFRSRLMTDRVVSTLISLRIRLDEICRQELDSFRKTNGPFSKDQDEMLNAMLSRMTQHIAGSLTREVRELPEKVEQEQMTAALQRLFHLNTPRPVAGGESAGQLRG
jgi:glutamyl-tRNA reductase